MDEVEKLIEELRNEDPSVRKKAAKALGEIKDPRAVDALIEALVDKDSYVREKATESLVKIGEQAVPKLMKASKNENPVMRMWAAYALKKIGIEPKEVQIGGSGRSGLVSGEVLNYHSAFPYPWDPEMREVLIGINKPNCKQGGPCGPPNRFKRSKGFIGIIY